jgi:hypothetical protein
LYHLRPPSPAFQLVLYELLTSFQLIPYLSWLYQFLLLTSKNHNSYKWSKITCKCAIC